MARSIRWCVEGRWRLWLIAAALLLFLPCSSVLFRGSVHADEKLPKVALVTTVWRQNSHADVIAGRLLESYSLDGQGKYPRLKLASIYVDQSPAGDKSRELAARYNVPRFDSIAKALTLGGDRLAVDGVLIVAEHGEYPKSATGQTVYPKRRMFAEVLKVFDASGRVAPIFSDKHLADNWKDIEWIYRETQKRRVPLMAGSSLPTTWRNPATDVKRNGRLKEIVAISYGPLDAYGFHALEMVQCLAERRQGGETGVRQVRTLEGDAVWQAGREGLYDPALLREAVGRFQLRPLREGTNLEERVKRPVAYVIDYEDGLRATILTLNGAAAEWTVAWRYADGKSDSTLFRVEEDHPYGHFTYLVQGIEHLMHQGQPRSPIERTVLTSGLLDALLVSRQQGGATIETPQLKLGYESEWDWRQPD